LHKTAEWLNKHEQTPLLCFRSGHVGTAFVWQWAVSAAELRALLAAAGDPCLLTAGA